MNMKGLDRCHEWIELGGSLPYQLFAKPDNEAENWRSKRRSSWALSPQQVSKWAMCSTGSPVPS